jgi:hypothetical protein
MRVQEPRAPPLWAVRGAGPETDWVGTAVIREGDWGNNPMCYTGNIIRLLWRYG